MAKINGEAHHIKVYNLPQNIKGGIKIHGFSDSRYSLPEKPVLLFTHLEGMQAFCKVDGTDNTISIDANIPLVELGNDEYQVEEQKD